MVLVNNQMEGRRFKLKQIILNQEIRNAQKNYQTIDASALRRGQEKKQISFNTSTSKLPLTTRNKSYSKNLMPITSYNSQNKTSSPKFPLINKIHFCYTDTQEDSNTKEKYFSITKKRLPLNNSFLECNNTKNSIEVSPKININISKNQ